MISDADKIQRAVDAVEVARRRLREAVARAIANGMTVDRAARLAGVHRVTVFRWRRGHDEA
jgi:transposase-like protein